MAMELPCQNPIKNPPIASQLLPCQTSQTTVFGNLTVGRANDRGSKMNSCSPKEIPQTSFRERHLFRILLGIPRVCVGGVGRETLHFFRIIVFERSHWRLSSSQKRFFTSFQTFPSQRTSCNIWELPFLVWDLLSPKIGRFFLFHFSFHPVHVLSAILNRNRQLKYTRFLNNLTVRIWPAITVRAVVPGRNSTA